MSDHLPKAFSLKSILLSNVCAARKDSVKVIDQRQPETNPVTIKRETVSDMAEPSSAFQ